MTAEINGEALKGIGKTAERTESAWEDAPRGAFFGRGDWAAFWVAGLATLAVYFFTLAPTVTLEDSGELAVASDYLGVPHPPGYPIWTLVTWLFQLVFHWVKYNGHPNPAWSVGLASAVAGAGACGLLALLISRSGRDLLAGWGERTQERTQRVASLPGAGWIAAAAGVSGGLLLAFSPVMWSQSVIVEVYSLNALFQMAVVLLVYMWMCRPKRVQYLYWAGFLFGLGLTNHQTLLFLMLALVVAILMKDTDLFRDFVLGAAFVAPAFLLGMKGIGWFWKPEAIAAMQLPAGHVPNAELWKWSQGPESAAFWIYNYVFLAVPAALWAGWTAREKGWQSRLGRGALAALGVYLLVVACNRWFINEPEPRGAEFFGTWSPWLWNSVRPAGDQGAWGAFDRCVWQGYAPGYGVVGGALRAAGPTFQWLCWLMLLLPLAAALPKLPKGKTVAITMLLAELGVAFYLYLPLASDQNPPMNWGYARTWGGFMHAVTRGQYEAITATDVFSQKFVEQLGSYLSDLRGQFTLPITVLGFLPFCAWSVARPRGKGRRLGALPVALGLLAVSLPLFALEGFGVDVKAGYKLLAGLVLLLAGVGLAAMAAGWLRQFARDWRGWSPATRVVSAGFVAALALAALWVDVKSLQAIFPSAEALDEAQKAGRYVLTNLDGTRAFLNTTGMAFFWGVVLAPPAALAAAWALGRWPNASLRMDLGDAEQRWILTSLVGFFAVSVVFLIFQNPTLDLQQLFIGRVQFIQSHAFYAMWLGYGVMLAMACLNRMVERVPDAALRWQTLGMMAPDEYRRWSRGVMLLLAVLLPGVLVIQNAYDEEQIKIVGGAEQNGHSYGWQFGNWGLEGVKGIKEDFGYWYGGEDSEEFKAQWGAYCEAMGSDDPQYPPPMTQGAVFYGGTDPGRFVPTYMIYSADVRSDVYLITQNALADNTFMNITRDLYGDTIYIPSVDESNAAFQRYLADVEAGRAPAGADIKVENGRISVQGVGGVMAINGILAKLIFEENKARHDFYVEESYAIQWMYPYLQPNGIMLKLNAEPMGALPGDVVDNDHRFWGWYTPWLLGQSTFTRDICARKAFSKLRTAIGGIYEYRRMYDEAEYAYQQAIDLYPLSPEAIFRLAQMRVNWGHRDEAEELLAGFVEQDPHNGSAVDFLGRLREMKVREARFEELRQKRGNGGLDIEETREFLFAARALGRQGEAYQLALELMQSPDTPAETLLMVSGIFVEDRRLDLYAYTLEEYLRREPRDADAWLELGAAYSTIDKAEDALRAARRAVDLSGAAALSTIAQDPRYRKLAGYGPFREWAAAKERELARPVGPRLAPGALGGALGGAALPGVR
jgi:tetratricopeptide (TPR) repeat protein